MKKQTPEPNVGVESSSTRENDQMAAARALPPPPHTTPVAVEVDLFLLSMACENNNVPAEPTEEEVERCERALRRVEASDVARSRRFAEMTARGSDNESVPARPSAKLRSASKR